MFHGNYETYPLVVVDGGYREDGVVDRARLGNGDGVGKTNKLGYELVPSDSNCHRRIVATLRDPAVTCPYQQLNKEKIKLEYVYKSQIFISSINLKRRYYFLRWN